MRDTPIRELFVTALLPPATNGISYISRGLAGGCRLGMAGKEDAGETEFTTRIVEITINAMANTMINASGNTFDILRTMDLTC